MLISVMATTFLSVVQFATTDASGTFSNGRDDRVDVRPGDGGRCEIKVTTIDEHGAGETYDGWQLEIHFSHPRFAPTATGATSLVRSVQMYWDRTRFASPFVADFDADYSYLHPYADPPERVSGQMNAATNTLTFGRRGLGGFTGTRFHLQLVPGTRDVESVTFEAGMFNDSSTRITCPNTRMNQ